MKKILVYFYGYKSKLLPQAVEQLIKNQSGQNDIHVVVYDQTNISRPEKFLGIEYNHIYWDRLISRFKCFYLLKKRKDFDFFMYVDGAKMFEKDWDAELLRYQDESDIILSGNHDIVFNKNNYKFYPDWNKTSIAMATKNNWFVKDFFFMKFSLFELFPDISIFKYYGVEEYVSMYAAHKGISIVALPTNFVIDQEPRIEENDFVPFSLYHNYSKVIDSFKSKDESMPGVKELMDLVDYDFRSLEYFPYNTNDVEYTFFSNLDKISEQRFHVVQNEVY
jgi:hypothetical protein